MMRQLPWFPGGLLLLLVPLLARGAGDPEGKQNLASASILPRQEGLAAAYPGDREITTHAAVIFAENFEDADFRQHWDEARDEGGEVLSRAAPGGSEPMLGDHVLKVTATLGRNTGGGLTKWFEPVDAVFVRFYVKFDKSCDYVHHFVTLRANKGLKGADKWSGFGGAGLKPNGDERFSTALEPWGNWGRFPAPGRWNFYSYWHTMSASRDGKFWGNGFAPESQPDIEKGRWICAEFMLRHNNPGQDDGEQAFWIDGELRGHWQGINWRASPGLLANALTLESYITERWTKHANNIVYFDNVVIASQYIGPSGK